LRSAFNAKSNLTATTNECRDPNRDCVRTKFIKSFLGGNGIDGCANHEDDEYMDKIFLENAQRLFTALSQEVSAARYPWFCVAEKSTGATWTKRDGMAWFLSETVTEGASL
jgi:hypothetical protein